MISYKTFKLLNESTIALGLGQKHSVGLVGSKLAEMGFGQDVGAEDPTGMEGFPPEDPSSDLGGDMGDEDMGDDMGDEQGEPCPACNAEGENEEGMEGCEVCGGLGWLPPEGEGEEDMEPSDELTGTDDAGDMDQDPSLDDHGQKPMMFQKKFMKKSACGKCCNSYMHKEEAEETEDDFMNSLNNQMKNTFDKKNNSGLSEEILIAMGEKEATSDEPAPGQVGYAPQGKLGGELGGGFKMDDFKEMPVLGQD